MTSLDKEKIEKQIIESLSRAGATKIGVFGSYARGEMSKDSDIDILVEFDRSKRITLIDFSKIHNELEIKVGREVDLLTFKGINPHIQPYIDKDLKIIYEKAK